MCHKVFTVECASDMKPDTMSYTKYTKNRDVYGILVSDKGMQPTNRPTLLNDRRSCIKAYNEMKIKYKTSAELMMAESIISQV